MVFFPSQDIVNPETNKVEGLRPEKTFTIELPQEDFEKLKEGYHLIISYDQTYVMEIDQIETESEEKET